MSDHNHITFELSDVKAEVQFGRNPRKTDWQGYVDELTTKVPRIPVRLSTTYEIEHCADSLSECIVSNYENNCSLWRIGTKKQKLVYPRTSFSS